MMRVILSRIFGILVFLGILVACTQDLSKSSGTDDLVIYPPPPDTTRIQYLTSFSSSHDIIGKQSAFNRYILGEEVPKPIIKPYGITVRNSKIYICDSGLGGLEIIDLAEKKFDYFIPGGLGQLQLPLNCSIDENGSLYVADGNRRQVVIFNSEGKYVSALGEKSEKFKPTDVVVEDDTIWVASVSDRKIFVYNRINNSLLFHFPDAEPGDEAYLYQPVNISVDPLYVYVSDIGDNKIKKFSHDGKYLDFTGGYGNYAGQLMRPKGIAVDDESNLYVVDAAFENVQIFNEEGAILMFFGGPYRRHGDMWLPADVEVSYSDLNFFSSFVDESFNLKYLIFVTNQYGPDKVSVYGFVGPKIPGRDEAGK